MHSHHPFLLSNSDNIKNIDESTSETFDPSSKKERKLLGQSSLDGPSRLQRKDSVKSEGANPKQASEADGNLLSVVTAERPSHRRFGSTKNLFVKQFSMDISEETPFLGDEEAVKSTDSEIVVLNIIKHDSQESVERVIKERRKVEGKSSETDEDIYDHRCVEVSEGADGKDIESRC